MKTLILIHTLASICIYFLGIKQINKQERFCNFILSLLLPIGGYFIVILLYISRNEEAKDLSQDEDIEKNIVLFTDRYNKDRATNFVPLEETLLINTTAVKRRQLIEVLKQDAMRYIGKLKIALRDEDGETSHYAASVISKILRDLDFKIQALEAQYDKNKEDIKIACEYIEVLEEYLNTDLLDDFNKKRVIFNYINVLEELLKIDNNSSYYEKIINVLFDVDEFGKLEKYCNKYIEEYENESSYLLNLKFYYHINDNKKFNKTLEELINSSIKLSNKGLNIVRFWRKGA